MSIFTQDMINQALMLNDTSEVRSNIDRERPFSHSINVELFVTAATRALALHLVYLPKDKQLNVIRLMPVRSHTPTSRPEYRNKLIYVTASLKQRVVINTDGTKTVHNSNAPMVDYICKPSITDESGKVWSNPYNALLVSGHFRLVPVPSEINNADHIRAFNACSDRLIKSHYALVAHCEKNGTDVDTDPSYRAAIEPMYAEYQSRIQQLIAAGYVSLTQAIVAEESKLKPIMSLDSGMSNSNPFLNSREATRGCSFIPVHNEFFGSATIISSATEDDISPNLQLGLRDLGKADANPEDTTSRGTRQTASRLATVADRLGNFTSLILRRNDTRYHNSTSNDKSVAQSFNDNTGNNQVIMVRGSLTPMAIDIGVQANVNGLSRAAITVEEYRSAGNASLSASVDNITSDDIASLALENDGDMDSVLASLAQSDEAVFNFDSLLAGTVQDEVNTAESQPVLNKPTNDIL